MYETVFSSSSRKTTVCASEKFQKKNEDSFCSLVCERMDNGDVEEAQDRFHVSANPIRIRRMRSDDITTNIGRGRRRDYLLPPSTTRPRSASIGMSVRHTPCSTCGMGLAGVVRLRSQATTLAHSRSLDDIDHGRIFNLNLQLSNESLDLDENKKGEASVLSQISRRASLLPIPSLIAERDYPDDENPSLELGITLESTLQGANKVDESDYTEHLMSISQLMEATGCRLNMENIISSPGLDSFQAGNRLEKSGPNRITPPPRIPLWMLFLLQFGNVFMILLMVAALLSFIAYAIQPDDLTSLYLGVLLLIITLVTVFETFKQESKSEDMMAEFTKLVPETCYVHREGQLVSVCSINLVIGDLLQLHTGDKIPADCRIVMNEGLKSDQSSVTGEAEPVHGTVDAKSAQPLDAHNLLFYGSLVVDGSCLALVIRTGDATLMGRMVALTAIVKNKKSTLKADIENFVAIITIFALVQATLIFIIGLARKLDPIDVFIQGFIVVVVANIPQGLPTTVTASLNIIAERMAKSNVFVKKLDVIETLGSIDLICSDKTGTLTQNRMQVTDVWVDSLVILQDQFVGGSNNSRASPSCKSPLDSYASEYCDFEGKHGGGGASSPSSSGTQDLPCSAEQMRMVIAICTLNSRVQMDFSQVDSACQKEKTQNMNGDLRLLGDATERGLYPFMCQTLRMRGSLLGIHIPEIHSDNLGFYHAHSHDKLEEHHSLGKEEEEEEVYDPSIMYAARKSDHDQGDSTPFRSEQDSAETVEEDDDPHFPKGEKHTDLELIRANSPKLYELAFNSSNKFQLSVHGISFIPHVGEGEKDYVLLKGAPDVLASMTRSYLGPNGVAMYSPEALCRRDKAISTFASQGKRVIGLASATLVDSYESLCRRDEEFPNRLKDLCIALSTTTLEDGASAIDIENAQQARNKLLDEFDGIDQTFGFTYAGAIAISDPPRPEVAEAIAECKLAGVQIIMITGDLPNTASAIAHQIGIISQVVKESTLNQLTQISRILKSKLQSQGGYVEQAEESKEEETKEDVERGLETSTSSVGNLDEEEIDIDAPLVIRGNLIKQLNDEQWWAVTSSKEVIFARTSPEDKLRIVNQFTANANHLGEPASQSRVVGMTGDGVNDAPALKAAKVGIAMGLGSAVAKEAADIVLLDDNFASIVYGIRQGRLLFANLKKSIAYTLTHLTPELLPVFMWVVIGFPLAMNGVLTLCIDLLTELLPATSLAYEISESDIMRVPPRNLVTEKLVDYRVLIYAYLQAGVIITGINLLVMFQVYWSYGISPDEVFSTQNKYFPSQDGSSTLGFTPEEQNEILAAVQASWFFTIVICQGVHVHVCRTRTQSIFTHGLFTNPVTWLGVGVAIVLASILVYTPGLKTITGAGDIDSLVMLYVALLALALLWSFTEGRKYISRNYTPCACWNSLNW